MLQKLRSNKEGFTLIELMIVIAIIGILAAIAIPNFISYRNKAYCTGMETDASAVAAEIASYFSVPTNMTVSDASIKALLPDGVGGRLSNNNTYAITANGTGWDVTVTDGSSRCILSSGGSSTFVKTIR
jgi:prepilin-type N-terminal cleavage/methylation domain-containing protein